MKRGVESDIDTKVLADIFFNVFLRTDKKKFIYNVYCMKNKKFSENLLKDIDNKEQILELQNFSSS